MTEAKIKKKLGKKTEQIDVKQVRSAVEAHVDEIQTQELAPHIEPTIEVPKEFKTKLTKSQVELVKRTIAKGASDDELKMFLYVCQRTGLDPFTKQIHLVPRWDSKIGKEVRMPITGIDGLRSIAERTDAYAGNDDPVFDDEEKPTKATVTVYKMVQGQRVPFAATARWKQYYPGEKGGFMWNKMPHLMLGKCAEALALRKAFPAVMSGLYVAEEMGNVPAGKPEPSAYDKAREIISKQTDEMELMRAMERIEKSDKYSEKEKKDIRMLVAGRIAEIKKDAPKTIPELQSADSVGEESAGL